MNVKYEFQKLGKLSEPKTWSKDGEVPGVYVWIEDYKGEKFVDYVGKHTISIFGRNLFHFENVVSGQEMVPKKYFESLGDDKFTSYTKNDYFKSRKHHVYSNIENLRKYMEIGFQFRDNITVYFLKADKDQVADLEGAIIAALEPASNMRRPSSKLSIPRESISFERLGNDQIVINTKK